MIGHYDISTGAVVELSAAQTRAEEARKEVMRVGRLIDDATEVCECGNPDPQIGCCVPHDEHADDLADAMGRCVDVALEADPSRSRGEILSELLVSLERLSRHVAWEEIIPQKMEREIHQYALRRMEVHGLPKLSNAA